MDIQTAVKLNVYETLALTGGAPAVEEVAAALGLSVPEVEGAFRNLYAQRLLFLEPGTTQIRMAPPFSAIETSFRVVVDARRYYANCAWDAFGIAAALGKDADIYASCGDCGADMLLHVREGAPVHQDCVIHFAVPAAHWWDDLIYT